MCDARRATREPALRLRLCVNREGFDRARSRATDDASHSGAVEGPICTEAAANGARGMSYCLCIEDDWMVGWRLAGERAGVERRA